MFSNNLKELQWNISFQHCFENNCLKLFSLFQNMFNESFPLKFFKNNTRNTKQGKTGLLRECLVTLLLETLVKRNENLKKYKKVFKAVCNKAKQLSNCNF